MHKLFKKVISGALALSLIPWSFCASAYNVGDRVGKVLSTDIITYIDGIRVPSFNIAGRTAVIVENLNACGLTFGVNYDDSSRTLTVAGKDIFGTGGRGFFHFDNFSSSRPVGTPVMDVLYTDIRTVFGETVLESFNIGGFTCVYADDLAALCGSYEWSEEARTVNVRTVPLEILPSALIKEAEKALPAEESIITKDETFERWAEPCESHLIQNSDGTFFTVEISEHINIEKYDSNLNYMTSFAIKKELPIFGALYQGKDFNYIAFGQENLLDDHSREVIKIVIYDKNFVKISEVSVNNCKTAIPFDASAGEMYENDRYLVLHTSRSQYRDEDGNRPQTQLTVIVDKATWTASNMLGKFQPNHTSHALREFVKIDGERLITANYSDAAPIRGAFLQELDFSGNVIHTQSIFNVGGPLAANCTGGMIGGFEISDSGFLVTMSTIDHSLPTGYSSVNIEGIDRENRDIYLLWTNKDTWEMKHTCLARYTGVELTGSVPYLVKLPDGGFMALWQRFSDYSNTSNAFCYAYIDKDGNLIGKVMTSDGLLSDSCQPIVAGGRVIWYVNTESGRKFYGVSTDSSEALKSAEEESITEAEVPVSEKKPSPTESENAEPYEEPDLKEDTLPESENTAEDEEEPTPAEEEEESSPEDKEQDEEIYESPELTTKEEVIEESTKEGSNKITEVEGI